ncbi:hypothetical protein [Chondromyces apiculatus]|uniref:Uncharacterized protein n=1 Tax=Chondromyces apiculatus DSM 436 TaxID=1192034 RepID=A0A017T005_9BACT|nr:hypothetical protein [Chondromyces apiculatus]EYF01901.1 Hypothetical protein CAP_7669 [Chondromyces apiculatus DSM 436]
MTNDGQKQLEAAHGVVRTTLALALAQRDHAAALEAAKRAFGGASGRTSPAADPRHPKPRGKRL